MTVTRIYRLGDFSPLRFCNSTFLKTPSLEAITLTPWIYKKIWNYELKKKRDDKVKSNMGYKGFHLRTSVLFSLYLKSQWIFRLFQVLLLKNNPTIWNCSTIIPTCHNSSQGWIFLFMTTDLKLLRPMPKPFILLISMFAYYQLGVMGWAVENLNGIGEDLGWEIFLVQIN